MPRKKIEQTSEQIELYNELKKLAKQANQRILRLEREFPEKTWAVKNLEEKLSVEPLKALSASGRVRVSKQYTETQMSVITNELKKFIKNKTSTPRRTKKNQEKKS